MHSPYKFFIANSNNLTRIADITKQCYSRQFQLAFNRGGSFSWDMPLETEFIDDLNPVKNCIICQKNKQTVWSGPIWTKNESFHDDRITLSAVGWLQLLQKRILIEDVTYENIKRGAIIHELLEEANTQYATWITPGSDSEGASEPDITRSFEKYTYIGPSIESLTEEESGPNIDVDPTTRQLNIKAWDDFNDLTTVILGFEKKPRNAETFERNFDADEMSNEIHVVGQTVAGYADSTASQDYHEQLFQDVITVSDTNDSSLLGAIANSEILVNGYPRILYKISPKSDSSTSDSVPSFFEDYNIGDQIYISAKRHNINISPHPVRVFSANISIDENGTEKISDLGITYQSG